MEKILRASPFYLEKVRGLRLDQRKKKGQISYVLLNQPPLCDSRCRGCFMPKNRRRDEPPPNSLTLDECKRVLDEAKEHGALCLEISGEGEPLLSENLRAIITHASKLGLLTTLITNGHLLSREFVEFLLRRNVTLVLSLHAFSEDGYERDNEVPGSFERKMEILRLAGNIFLGSIEVENGFEVYRLAIHATAQADNLEELKSMKEFAETHGFFFSIAPLAQTGCALDNPEIRLEDTKDEDILSLAHNSIILSLSSEYELGREVCGTCFYGLNIGYEGSLLLDVHGGYELQDRLGNIKTHSVKELLEIREPLVERMFRSIDGFCPIRDPKWNDFLDGIQTRS